MKRQTAKLFMNGRSQAIRLPKDFRFKDVSEVMIYAVGNKLYIEPIHESWGPLLQAINQFPDDFELERAPTDKSFKDIF